MANHVTKEQRVQNSPDDADAPRVLLKDRAYDELKELILTGVYAPGTFLSERQLASQLGMSKTPIRSAIERLEMDGFLIVSPQQGIVVSELSLQEIIDHFEIRVALETFTMRRLAGRLSDDQLKRLQKNLEAQARCAKQGAQGVDRYRQLDTEFHVMLCDFLSNQEIIRVMWRLRDKLARVIYRVIQARPERMTSSYQEHTGILEALMEGDGELAATRMEEHLGWGRRFLASS